MDSMKNQYPNDITGRLEDEQLYFLLHFPADPVSIDDLMNPKKKDGGDDLDPASEKLSTNGGSSASSVYGGGNLMPAGLKKEEEINRKGKNSQTWTEEEKSNYALAMRDGKGGDWVTVSRDYVKTRTPSQLSNYAYRLKKRQEKEKLKKRSSSGNLQSEQMSSSRVSGYSSI